MVVHEASQIGGDNNSNRDGGARNKVRGGAINS
jgi:hypothetical protein